MTKDGSPSLYDPVLDETYHSTNGAISESQHVFIGKGFHAPALPAFCSEHPLRIFEVGFGTGINAWLTQQEAERTKRPVIYESIEPYPLKETSWVEFEQALGAADGTFEALHRAPWNESTRISPRFELLKRNIELERLEKSNTLAGLIYYDAFGAKADPEMWEPASIEKALERAGNACVFVTYAAKGSLKRTLRRAGWQVEILDGALGKREMIRGVKGVSP